MFNFLWRLLTRDRKPQTPCEPPRTLTLREWADLPTYHPGAETCRS